MLGECSWGRLDVLVEEWSWSENEGVKEVGEVKRWSWEGGKLYKVLMSVKEKGKVREVIG